MKPKNSLKQKYPPSPACSCSVCISYCRRPGWWTVEGAAAAMAAGHGGRMMLEMDPGKAFAVLSPAFKGNEQGFAAAEFANEGCTFLTDARCELHDTAHLPLECEFCHHDRPGQGERCHADITRQWNSAAGRALVVRWSNETEFWQRLPTVDEREASRFGAMPRMIEVAKYRPECAEASQDANRRLQNLLTRTGPSTSRVEGVTSSCNAPRAWAAGTTWNPGNSDD